MAKALSDELVVIEAMATSTLDFHSSYHCIIVYLVCDISVYASDRYS